MAKHKFTHRKLMQYLKDAETVKFLRRNPVIACELLLGIKLIDAQAWMLQESWNKPYILWNCSRNFGKSFLGAIFMMLKAMLYPNQRIYIVSNSGSQSIETFQKMEDIANSNINSIDFTDSYTGKQIDVFLNEIVKSATSGGFVHDKTSHKVVLFNGSRIYTLNSVPKNVKGKRASVLFIDESCFCSEDLIVEVMPFLAQSSEFKTSTNSNFNIKRNRKQIPNQVIWASSAGDADHIHARTYKVYMKMMLAGSDDYFVADMPCDIPLNPTIDGESITPYLTQETIDLEYKKSPQKAEREYRNKFQADGGQTQMIKWSQIRRNESLYLPKMCSTSKDQRFWIAFDPARMNDNSIIGVMEEKYDDNIGYYGEICLFTNLIELGNKKKIPMKTPDQIKALRQVMLDFNGKNKDYDGINSLGIDAGSGGGGVGSFSDNLLEDWYDSQGYKHIGMIDKNFDAYATELKNYPNAWTNVNLISPQKYRHQMCEEFSELMHLDLIKFTQEYNGRGNVSVPNLKTGELETRNLSLEEEVALMNIDLLKSEITSIHKLSNGKYGIPPDKARTLKDDRFYVIIMLASALYEKRRIDQLSKSRSRKKIDLSEVESCASAISF